MTKLSWHVEPVVRRTSSPVAVPTLLLNLEPGHRTFFRNLADLFRRQEPPRLACVPGVFWPDVFVTRRPAWTSFAESAIYHVTAMVVIWGATQIWLQRPRIVDPPASYKPEVIYYEAPEYLQPIDTRAAAVHAPQKGDPEHAPQPIISVPPESDNRQQTIVVPPKLKLNQDVPLPNIVALQRPAPAVPVATAAVPASKLNLPPITPSVIAPAPEIRRNKFDPAPVVGESVVAPAPEVNAAVPRRSLQASQPAIVEPPPKLEGASNRRLSDINIGHAQVVAPAPQLPVDEQHALTSVARVGGSNPAVVPPPPSVQVSGGGDQSGRLIALNLHPVAPAGPVDVPAGNRRGTFAATPDGKAGASGTPDIQPSNVPAGSGSGQGRGADSQKNPNGVPPGLFVGAGPKSAPSATIAGEGKPGATLTDPRLVAGLTPPRVGGARGIAAELPPEQETEEDRSVFGARRPYTMPLNVPNLNSAGGSWVMHFAELKDGEKGSDLLAPVVTRTVDPGYPIELMRENVQGVVTLSAVIQSDGRVGEVKVLNGIDDRLDQYACAALSRWQFLPALRAGSPVPLQAVVMIPFKPRRGKPF
jgi:TonB family protein